MLLIGDIIQPGDNVRRRDPPEGKALAARKNRGRNLVQLRGSEDEQQMLRRFLDDLEQRVEGAGGKHMHLIDDIHARFDL